MKKLFSVLVASSFGLTACGGGGSTNSVTILDGVFKDSNVAGLTYESGSQKGITDLKGKFRYEEGTEVKFSLGGIDFGAAIGKGILTPIDLVDNGNLGSLEVVNRVRFLMMLDKNNKPSDGIEISPAIQNIAKDWETVDFSSSDFLSEVSTISAESSAADGIAHTLPESSEAVSHMRTTLLCSYSGGFLGSFSGEKSGNVAFVVDPVTGRLAGSTYDAEAQVSINISATSPIDSDNEFDFVSTDEDGKQYTGKLTSTDALQGTWEDTQAPAINGDFNATRQGGDSTAVYRYSAAFTGSDKGIMTFDVDAGNRVETKVISIKDKSTVELTSTIAGTTLTGSVVGGIKINGVIDETNNTLQGVWTNLSDLTTGTFVGSGCRLN